MMGRPDDDDFEDEFDDDEFEEEFEEEDEEYEEVDEDDDEEEEEEEEAPAPAPQAAPQPRGGTQVVSPRNIPLCLTVEVGRVRMNAKQLLDLKPGAMMEINADPEGAIDLVANGACIGKGELIRIGDVLGVRVLELG